MYVWPLRMLVPVCAASASAGTYAAASGPPLSRTRVDHVAPDFASTFVKLWVVMLDPVAVSIAGFGHSASVLVWLQLAGMFVERADVAGPALREREALGVERALGDVQRRLAFALLARVALARIDERERGEHDGEHQPEADHCGHEHPAVLAGQGLTVHLRVRLHDQLGTVTRMYAAGGTPAVP